MVKVAMVLKSDIENKSGRNEKMRSRFRAIKKEGWNVKTFVLNEPDSDNDLFKMLYVFIKSFIVSMWIKEFFNGDDKNIVCTMNSPSYLHIPGLILKKFGSDIYWVAEFRDAMCEEPYFSMKYPATRKLNRLIEGPTVINSDLILKGKGSQCSDEYFEINYGMGDKVKLTSYQGYDLEKFKDISPKEFEKYTITYAGRFYNGWIEPSNFLRGFKRFVVRTKLTPEDIQILFYQKGMDEKNLKLIKELGLSEYIDINGYVETNEIISIMKGSDLLMYITGSGKSNKKMIHSKFWDYIVSRSDILFLTKKGYKVNLYAGKFKLGYLADEDDPAEISNKLKEAYYDPKETYVSNEKMDKIFNRDIYNEVFVKRLKEITDG